MTSAHPARQHRTRLDPGPAEPADVVDDHLVDDLDDEPDPLTPEQAAAHDARVDAIVAALHPPTRPPADPARQAETSTVDAPQ